MALLICIVVSLIYLGHGYSRADAATQDNTVNDATNQKSSTISTIQAANIEETATPVKVADARMSSKLLIDNKFVDPDNNCEFCTRIQYTPGKEGEAGLAYRDTKIDLNDSQRLVFFVRSQEVGQASFVAAGNDTTNVNNNDTDVFPKIDFAIVTKNVTLNKDWQRFEIGLNDTQLEDVSYPFGIQLDAEGSSKQQIFYLKGVTLDSKSAVDPLLIVNQSEARSITPILATIQANSTNTTGTPAVIEFKANATGGTAPYSFSWNFGDGRGVNDTGVGVGQITSHTFSQPGLYNITLMAYDSNTPPKNASANILVTVTPSVNSTSPLIIKGDDNSMQINNTVPAVVALEVNVTEPSAFDNRLYPQNTSANELLTVMSPANITKALTPKVDANSTTKINATGGTELDPETHAGNGSYNVPVIIASPANATESIYIATEPRPTKLGENNIGSTRVDENSKSSDLPGTMLNQVPKSYDQMAIIEGNNLKVIQLKGSDPNNDPITFEIVSKPSQGTIIEFDKKTGSASYLADPRATGFDQFSFKVTDDHNEESSMATVSIALEANQDKTLAVSDASAVTFTDNPIEVMLKAAGITDEATLKFVVTSSPAYGKLRGPVNTDQTSAKVTYLPNRGYEGNDIFEFKAQDVNGGSSNIGKVSIAVISPPQSQNSPPVALSQSIKIDQERRQNIILEGIDTDDEKLTFSLVTRPSHGKVSTFDPLSGKLIYKAEAKYSGDDSFTFKATDPDGAVSNIARVSITIDSTNSSPTEVKSVPPRQDTLIKLEKIGPSDNLNYSPSAIAGPDFSVLEGTKLVTLKGSSNDPDDDVVSYSWEQTSGPRLELNRANTDTATFDAPDLEKDMVLKFKLRVMDEKGRQDVDEVRIVVKNSAALEENHQFNTGNQTR